MKIEKFYFGLITIDGKDFENDVLLLPPRIISPWWRKEGHSLCMMDLTEALDFSPDSLVIGTGVSKMMKVPDSLIRDLEAKGIKVESMATGQACDRFNMLMKKGEKAVGAMHLTC